MAQHCCCMGSSHRAAIHSAGRLPCAGPPLVPLYDGPYTHLHGVAQYFTIQMGAKEEVVSTSRLKPCRTPDVAPVLPHRGGRLLRSAGQFGLPPWCPADHPCTPPALPCAGEGAGPHGWLPPRRGRSCGRFPSTSLPTVEAPCAPSPPTVEAPTPPSLLTVEEPTSPSLPTVEAPPSILVQPGRPRHPARRVCFQDQRKEPPSPVPCSQSETVFHSTPAGDFARSDWSSTKWLARQRRQPAHLDLYTEVWGVPCGEEHSAAAVQQQHQVAPATREPSAFHLRPLCASCYWEEEGGVGSLLLRPCIQHNPGSSVSIACYS